MLKYNQPSTHTTQCQMMDKGVYLYNILLFYPTVRWQIPKTKRQWRCSMTVRKFTILLRFGQKGGHYPTFFCIPSSVASSSLPSTKSFSRYRDNPSTHICDLSSLLHAHCLQRNHFSHISHRHLNKSTSIHWLYDVWHSTHVKLKPCQVIICPVRCMCDDVIYI